MKTPKQDRTFTRTASDLERKLNVRKRLSETTALVSDAFDEADSNYAEFKAHFDFGADGHSVGILKKAERPNAIDLGKDTYLNGHALYGAHGMLDSRDRNDTPKWYIDNYGRGAVWELKTLATVGIDETSDEVVPVQTIIPSVDQSEGLLFQIAYDSTRRWKRMASSDEEWNPWESDALIAYPIGSVYIASNDNDPNILFGGSWESFNEPLFSVPDGTQVTVWHRTA